MSTLPRHVLTILAVDDLGRAKRFYGEAFGWPLEVDLPVYVEFVLPGAMRFGIYEGAGFAKNVGQPPARTPSGGISATELYFHVDDLPGAIDRVQRAGARELSACAPRAWGDDAAYFADPDGNVLVLARPGGK